MLEEDVPNSTESETKTKAESESETETEAEAEADHDHGNFDTDGTDVNEAQIATLAGPETSIERDTGFDWRS